jgi:malonyl-CoA O-methyltransferase
MPSVDLVWSNMALHWLSDPLPALREFRRVLAPNGLLMFSTLGPDSLKELRAAAGERRVHAFIDMHDLGDMLLAAGLAAPVMDMELITLEYPDAGTLLDDLRGSGQTSARADRPRGLAGRAFAERLHRALGEKPRASFEVVYGHAWRPPTAGCENSSCFQEHFLRARVHLCYFCRLVKHPSRTGARAAVPRRPSATGMPASA